MITSVPEKFRDFPRSIIEDFFQVGFHDPSVSQAPDEPKGESVTDHVAHACATIDRLEAMGVFPEAVRPTQLHIHEANGWIPAVNFGDPAHGQPMPAEPVFDQRSWRHRDRRRRKDLEAQPSSMPPVRSRTFTDSQGGDSRSNAPGRQCQAKTDSAEA